MSGDIGVAADGTFVPVGASGAPTQRPSRAARREEEKEEKERARRKKARESAAARGGEEKKGGIRLLPTLMLFVMFGPAIFPVMLMGWDFLASTSVGIALYDGCIDVGVCTTYHDQLKAIYERESPKKVKNIPRLLKKWRGREGQLIKEVESKYEQRRRYESIRKAAMERDKEEQRGKSEHERGSRRKSSSEAKKEPSPPPPKASGWDEDDAGDAPPEEMWDDEEDDADDIMADMNLG